jgi:hypothetical protein
MRLSRNFTSLVPACGFPAEFFIFIASFLSQRQSLIEMSYIAKKMGACGEEES